MGVEYRAQHRQRQGLPHSCGTLEDHVHLLLDQALQSGVLLQRIDEVVAEQGDRQKTSS